MLTEDGMLVASYAQDALLRFPDRNESRRMTTKCSHFAP
jgi:hypothetical protein